MGLHEPDKAADMYQQALQLDDRNAAAKVRHLLETIHGSAVCEAVHWLHSAEVFLMQIFTGATSQRCSSLSVMPWQRLRLCQYLQTHRHIGIGSVSSI